MTTPPRRPGDKYGTAPEVAQHYRLSLRKVRQLIADGILPAHKITGTNRLRIDWDEADKALLEPPNPTDQ